MKKLTFLLGFFVLTGCATVDPEQSEYNRVDYIESTFKPSVAACKAQGGAIVYNGPYSQKMRRILDTEDWSRLHRLDTLYFACDLRS